MTTNERIIRLVIASDNQLFRECLCQVLTEQTNIEIVAEAVNTVQATEVISQVKPDIILLGITLPELNDLQIIPLIKHKSPVTKVILISGGMDEDAIIKAIKSGAKGHLSHDSSISRPDAQPGDRVMFRTR